ncbi:MAG TPA: hypothetical protein VH480_13065 [Streptosporangiaceae bacterium]|jgi:hypothetical protein
MRRVIVRYKVKPDRVGENEKLVRAVYEELHQARPAGFRYATFRLDDGQTFVHLASQETDDGSNPLTGIAAFGRFSADIGDRCEEPPQVTEMHEIGSYRLFGGETGAS